MENVFTINAQPNAKNSHLLMLGFAKTISAQKSGGGYELDEILTALLQTAKNVLQFTIGEDCVGDVRLTFMDIEGEELMEANLVQRATSEA